VIHLPSRRFDEYKVACLPPCVYFQYNSLVLGRYILTNKFSPSHIAVFFTSPSVGFVQPLLPFTPRSLIPMDFSSESPVIGDHSIHIQEESGLAQDRRMPFVQCPEQTLTLPMRA